MEIFVPRDPAFARVFSRRSAILKIVEEKALETRLQQASNATGYHVLRDYQKKTVEAYLSGRSLEEVFVSAPTGAGKSLTFLTPYAFDCLNEDQANSNSGHRLGGGSAYFTDERSDPSCSKAG